MPPQGPKKAQGPRTLGIGVRLAAVMMFCAVVPTALLGVLSVSQLRDEAHGEFVRGSLTLVRVIGFGLDAVLQDARRTLEVSASDPVIAQGGWVDGERRGAIVARLRATADRYPLFEGITVLDPQGRALFAARSPKPSPVFEVFSPELADNYGGYVSDVYRAGPRGNPYIFMVVEVRGEDLTKLGFLAAEIDLSTLYSDLDDALGEGGERRLLIVDSQGRAIYPPSAWAEEIGSMRGRDPAVDRVLSTLEEGHVVYDDAEGEPWIAVYKSMIGYHRTRGVRWGVVLSQRTEVAFAQADKAAWQTVLIAAGFLMLALMISLPLARWMTRALSRLAAHALAIGQEGVEASGVPAHLGARGDEIGALARAMAAMQIDLRHQQRELERRHEALRRAERLSGVGLLAAGVAHEINNPLTTILGYSEFLLEDKDPDHLDRSSLELIASEADRVRDIVRGLLELSRRRQHRESLDLREVLQRAVTLSQAGLSMDDIALDLDEPAEPVVLEGERQALLQVLMNLISNAVDALERADGPEISLGCALDGETVRLWVADNGPGMSKEVEERLFEPFYTTKASGKGTGLGMAILSSIVDDHGGRIEVDSAVGKGARFTIWLPREHKDLVSAV